MRRYISDVSGLKRYGACLHLLARPPDVLVVDDLSELVSATRCAGGMDWTGWDGTGWDGTGWDGYSLGLEHCGGCLHLLPDVLVVDDPSELVSATMCVGSLRWPCGGPRGTHGTGAASASQLRLPTSPGLTLAAARATPR